MTTHALIPRLVLAGVLAIGVPTLAACGQEKDAVSLPTSADKPRNDDGKDDKDDSGGKELSREDAWAKYSECMNENGVPTAAEGTPVTIDPEDIPSQEKIDAASKVCKPLMDKLGIQNGNDGEMPAEMKEQLLEVAECMRKKGYDWADPDASGNQVHEIPADGSVDVDKMMDDEGACAREAGLEFWSGSAGS